MRKAIATLFYRLANWFDSSSANTEYNQKRDQAIAKDIAKLKTIKYWAEDYQALEPFESLEFRELNGVFEELQSQLSQCRKNAEAIEEFSENFTLSVIRLLDRMEGVARGDLTVDLVSENHLSPYFGDIKLIAETFQIVLENFREIIHSLPEDHPLKQKYKI